jgi:hypothetical protein
MSLFDVIRYPIGDYPTAEQFKALPRELLIKWMEQTAWGSNVIRVVVDQPEWIPPSMVSYYSRREKADNNSALKEIKLLKKIIAEWDTDDNI